MIAPEPIHPFPWRICAAAALFTVLMVAAAVAANIFTISGDGKLPLMVPGLLALGWLIWEAMRLARGVPGSAIARYIGRVVPLMIANIVTVVAAITIQREWHPSGIWAVLVALLPAPPLMLLLEEEILGSCRGPREPALFERGGLLVLALALPCAIISDAGRNCPTAHGARCARLVAVVLVAPLAVAVIPGSPVGSVGALLDVDVGAGVGTAA